MPLSTYCFLRDILEPLLKSLFFSRKSISCHFFVSDGVSTSSSVTYDALCAFFKILFHLWRLRFFFTYFWLRNSCFSDILQFKLFFFTLTLRDWLYLVLAPLLVLLLHQRVQWGSFGHWWCTPNKTSLLMSFIVQFIFLTSSTNSISGTSGMGSQWNDLFLVRPPYISWHRKVLPRPLLVAACRYRTLPPPFQYCQYLKMLAPSMHAVSKICN